MALPFPKATFHFISSPIERHQQKQLKIDVNFFIVYIVYIIFFKDKNTFAIFHISIALALSLLFFFLLNFD